MVVLVVTSLVRPLLV